MARRMITIDGKPYKVTDNLGFQAGYRVKEVDDHGIRRIAVNRGGEWVWWTERDRLGCRKPSVRPQI